MSALRSFIVRVYRRRGSSELTGTLEPVGQAPTAGRPPQAFANETQLLRLMHAAQAPPPRPERPAAGRTITTAAPGARSKGGPQEKGG